MFYSCVTKFNLRLSKNYLFIHMLWGTQKPEEGTEYLRDGVVGIYGTPVLLWSAGIWTLVLMLVQQSLNLSHFSSP